MEQQSFSPEDINKGFPSSDFVLQHKELAVDFFSDNRHWYTKLLKGNTKRSPDITANKDDVQVDLPQATIWLHSEEDLAIDKDNPPLNPLLINEGRAEQIAKFFESWKEARDDFVVYSNSEQENLTLRKS